MTVVVEAHNLQKTFQQVQAVDGVSFVVEEGQFALFWDPAVAARPQRYDLWQDLRKTKAARFFCAVKLSAPQARGIFIPPEKRGIGMVFQSYAIWPHMTVFENVAFPLRIQRLPRAEIKEKVENILRLFDLIDLAPRLSTKLSGGQQQRVAIARALAVEPFNSFDGRTA